MLSTWSIAIVSLATIYWLAGKILQTLRDISPLALKQQANIAPVRKANETAHYRNFLVPNGFPLTTGLALSNQYKIRNGNIGDIWSAIVANNKNTIGFKCDRDQSKCSYNIGEINGLVKQIMKRLQNYSSVGILARIDTLPGFATYIALMLMTIKIDNFQFYLLDSFQYEAELELDLDLIVFDDSIVFTQLNHISNYFYIGLNDTKFKPLSHGTMILWRDSMQDSEPDNIFEYKPSPDNADDLKTWCNLLTDGKDLTQFIQLNLVSAIANFIKSFPLGHELNEKDILTIIEPGTFSKLTKTPKNYHHESSLQNWVKIFAVLLHGGSLTFCKEDLNGIIRDTTLLSITSADLPELVHKLTYKLDILQKLKVQLGLCVFNKGIFFNNNTVSNVRCIYSSSHLKRSRQISKFSKKTRLYVPGQIDHTIPTDQANRFRSIFGCRIVMELYIDNLILGPISATNFFDYRILPKLVEDKVSFSGALSTSLEGKFIEIEGFDIAQRQGMLCVRGFTIGKPLDKKRLEKAIKSSKSLARGEGWMPLMGVYGLWGHDGCLYLYK